MSREFSSEQRSAAEARRQQRRRPFRNANDPRRISGEGAIESRRGRRELYQVDPQRPDSFSLHYIISPDNLMVAWREMAARGGQTAGTDNISFDISGSMAWRVVRWVSDEVLCGSYRPSPTREIRIPRPGRSDRIIEIPTVGDRLVGKAIANALRPLYEDRLTRFYNVGREHIVARMKVEAELNQRFYILQDDIQECFPSANRELVSRIVREQSQSWCTLGLPVERFGLVWLIDRIIDAAGPNLNQNRSTGLTQGGTLSPFLMELTLHATVDAAFHAAASTSTILHRYVDDLCIQARDPSDAHHMMDTIRATVTSNGQTLKGVNVRCRDLRINSPEDDTVLGLSPQWDNGQLAFTITEKAWNRIRESLAELPLLARNPQGSIAETVSGWINSIMACIRNTDQDSVSDRITDMLDELDLYPDGEFNIPECIRHASRRWENLITETRAQYGQEPA